MDTIYKEMFDSAHLLCEQIRGIYSAGRAGRAGAGRAGYGAAVADQPSGTGRILLVTTSGWSNRCSRLDDGEDPLVIPVNGGCAAACQLATERVHCGYLIVLFEGYDAETLSANMAMVELILAQAQLICELLDKNNQLHHLRLLDLSRSSEVLTRT